MIASIMDSDQFPAGASRTSPASITEALRRAMRPRDGRAALRVAPGHQPELQRIIFCLLRETADLKGGSLLEIAPEDWLLTEAPTPEAERLQALISKLLPESQVQLLPLPQSRQYLAAFWARFLRPNSWICLPLLRSHCLGWRLGLAGSIWPRW